MSARNCLPGTIVSLLQRDVMVVATTLYVADGWLGLAAKPLARAGLLTLVSGIGFAIVVFAVDRGVVISGSDRALQAKRARARALLGAEG